MRWTVCCGTLLRCSECGTAAVPSPRHNILCTANAAAVAAPGAADAHAGAWCWRLVAVPPAGAAADALGPRGFSSVPWRVQRLPDGPGCPRPRAPPPRASSSRPRLLISPGPCVAPCSATALTNASYSLAAPSVSSQHSFWRFALADLREELRKVVTARKVAGGRIC
jgi:hypothetical protein